MRCYNSTGRYAPIYDLFYEQRENGEIDSRPPIDPKVRKVLDHFRERMSLRAMIESTADRARE
ncbi:hypothetical protein KY361_01815 [Candidatus Woesearchaeota archaeon]|nr:hypothetical protein [Candidatus Woesearchaeota archaeon]